MASSGKRKTTMAKLMREAKLRERKLEKVARKRTRQLEQDNPTEPVYGPAPADMDALDPVALDTVAPAE